MSRDTKVLIGIGAAVVVGLIVALTINKTLGLLVVALGLVGAFVAVRRNADMSVDPFADARTEADESQVGRPHPQPAPRPLEPRRRPERLDPTGEPDRHA